MARRLADTMGLPPECFTIEEFCATHRIGVSTYYRLKEEGAAPQEFRIGNKVLITKESAARWREARDKQAAQN